MKIETKYFNKDKRFWFTFECHKCNKSFYVDDVIKNHSLDEEEFPKEGLVFRNEYIESEAFCSPNLCKLPEDHEDHANGCFFDVIEGRLNINPTDRSSKNPEVVLKRQRERKQRSMNNFKETSYGEQDKNVRKYYSDKYGWKK